MYASLVSAILITGGENSGGALDTAELYLPLSNRSCQLPSLPGARYRHSLDAGLLCGGKPAERSCLLWSSESGAWEDFVTLSVKRYHHCSWTPDPVLGTFLIGGFESEGSSTLVTPGGDQEQGFTPNKDIKLVQLTIYGSIQQYTNFLKSTNISFGMLLLI